MHIAKSRFDKAWATRFIDSIPEASSMACNGAEGSQRGAIARDKTKPGAPKIFAPLQTWLSRRRRWRNVP
jgi:hypothetical protein